MRRKLKSMVIGMLVLLSTLSAFSLISGTTVSAQLPGPTLDPHSIPKYVSQLVIPPVYKPVNNDPHLQKYIVEATQFKEQILPSGFPKTTVWGYGGQVWVNPLTGQPGYFRNSPGPTFVTTRGVPVMVKWVNKLSCNGVPLHHLFAVDPTLHWANPNNMPMMLMPPFPAFPPGFPDAQTPVPLVTHVHGAEVQSTSDGGPNQWFTPNGIHGQDYHTVVPTSANSAVDYYPNEQLPATIWYHDHALGMTRLNVMSGLAGFFIIQDPEDRLADALPSGDHDLGLAIQDRSFNTDGSLWFPAEGDNPDIHPYWQPEFFGNTIMVNGKTWPNLNVDRAQYRFRVLDGSNARFYDYAFKVKQTGAILPYKQIGTDGGYLGHTVSLTHALIAPGERHDIIVDFSSLAPGTKVIMRNNAPAPYPTGDPVDPQTTGQIMQFTVDGTFEEPVEIPTNLINIPTLIPNVPSKTMTLYEVQGPNGPEEILLNGQKWSAPISELPRVGSTVDWKIVDTTMDTHPIHLHLVQFQLISRQAMDTANYTIAWLAANGNETPPFTHPTVNIPITPYLIGSPHGPHPNERGWKDTYQVNPGEVTTFRIRFAPQDTPTTGPNKAIPGRNLYPFDPTLGPGYVWHCHIIDHEDNEMMRPYLVTH